MPKHKRARNNDAWVIKTVGFTGAFWNRLFPYVRKEADGNLSRFVRDLAKNHMKKNKRERAHAA